MVVRLSVIVIILGPIEPHLVIPTRTETGTSVDVFVTEPFVFDEEYAQALVTPLHDNLLIRFVSLPTLIRMKEEADRPQDRAGIEQLRAKRDNDAKR